MKSFQIHHQFRNKGLQPLVAADFSTNQIYAGADIFVRHPNVFVDRNLMKGCPLGLGFIDYN